MIAPQKCLLLISILNNNGQAHSEDVMSKNDHLLLMHRQFFAFTCHLPPKAKDQVSRQVKVLNEHVEREKS